MLITRHPMQVFRSLPHAESRRPCALTIGNFDGVHQGHRTLLTHLTQEKKIDVAIQRIEALPVVSGKITRIRMEALQ